MNSPLGLGSDEAAARLMRDGPNALPAPAPESLARRLGRQFHNPLIYLLLFMFGESIAGTFSSNAEVTEVITTYLMILPLTYGAHGVVVLIMVSLNVLRRPRTALLLTFTRLMLFYIPLAYIGSQFWGLKGLFAGAALGNILAGIFAWFLIRKVSQELHLGPNYQDLEAEPKLAG